MQEFLLTALVEITKCPDRLALIERIERRPDGTALTAAELTGALSLHDLAAPELLHFEVSSCVFVDN